MMWVNELISSYYLPHFLMQMLVIGALFAIGYVICSCFLEKPLEGGTTKAYEHMFTLLSLSFPMGLAAFILIGYVMLAVGVPYTTLTVTVGMLVVVVCSVIYLVRGSGGNRFTVPVKVTVVTVVCVILLIAVSVSGIIAVSVSNDSLYYFWQYPKAVVSFAGLRDQFDNFLTDTGLGATVIGTLPFLYGFGETFGIQEFFHISFCLFFAKSIYDSVHKIQPDIKAKKALYIALVSGAVLVASTPMFVLSHWAMSNVYFMDYFFIGLYFVREYFDNNRNESIIPLMLIVFACSQLRMEGGIFILFLVVMASLTDIDGRKLSLCLVPTVVFQSIFELRIFCLYNIDNPYTFMTSGKSLIQFAAYMLVIVYLCLIRQRLSDKIRKYVPAMVLVALIGVNALLFIIDHNLYISNIRAFMANLFGQSGWGMFPYLTIGAFAIIAMVAYVNSVSLKKNNKTYEQSTSGEMIIYYMISTVGFLLVTLAVSFARGDALNESTGDSGNRVLLQIVPLVVYFVTIVLVSQLVKADRIDDGMTKGD